MHLHYRSFLLILNHFHRKYDKICLALVFNNIRKNEQSILNYSIFVQGYSFFIIN